MALGRHLLALLTSQDMRLQVFYYGVARDWAFDYNTLEPYYTRAEYAIGVCGPSDPALQWPPIRSKPYPMGPLPFGPGEQRFTDAAARIGLRNLPSAQARNSGISYHGRPPCCGNNNCFPVCPIAAKYDAATALPKIEARAVGFAQMQSRIRVGNGFEEPNRGRTLLRSRQAFASRHRQDLRTRV